MLSTTSLLLHNIRSIDTGRKEKRERGRGDKRGREKEKERGRALDECYAELFRGRDLSA